MATYRVRSGVTFGAFGQFGPGDLVVLTETEAGGFLDKLEKVEAPLPTPTGDALSGVKGGVQDETIEVEAPSVKRKKSAGV